MLSWVLVYDEFGATGNGSVCDSCSVWSSEVVFSLYLLLTSVVEKAAQTTNNTTFSVLEKVNLCSGQTQPTVCRY